MSASPSQVSSWSATRRPGSLIASPGDRIGLGAHAQGSRSGQALDERGVLETRSQETARALRDSEPASVRHRLESTGSGVGNALGHHSRGQALKQVAGMDADVLAELTEDSYINLVRLTGLQAYSQKRGKLSPQEDTPPEGLWSVANHPKEWVRHVQGTNSRYYRAIGSAETLTLKAADLCQGWMKGVSGEFALKKLREQPPPW